MASGTRSNLPGLGPGPGPRQEPEPQSETERLVSYVQEKAQLYEKDKIMDQDLWEIYQDEFKIFTLDSFKKVNARALQNLRNSLLSRGVFVEKNNKRTTLPQVLYNTCQEEEQHQWNDEEVQTVSNEREVNSRYLQRRLKTLGITNQPLVMPASQDQPGETEPLVTHPSPRPTNAGKLVSEIAKIYTGEQKYDGTNGSFDHKLTIFLDICDRVELPRESIMKAFPTMLKGLAQDHFYNNQLSQRTYEEVCTNLKNFFEGPGYHRRNLDKWNSTTLTSITAENPQKSTYESVQLLINTLRQLQYGLQPALRSTEFLHNKIVTACQGSPACRYAVADPPADLGGLVHKLQSSITSYEKEQESTETFYTDRRYYPKDRPGTRSRAPIQRPNRFNSHHTNRPNSRFSAPNQCFVCKKEGCRSWKHSEKEQAAEEARFRSSYQERFKPSPGPDFEKRFQRSFRQYVMNYEGDDPDSDPGELDTFETLFMANSTDSDPEIDPERQEQDTEAFFTSIGSLSRDLASSTVTELAKRALLHQLTGETPTPLQATIPISQKDLSVYNMSLSRYDSRQFHGIMIDTGAATCSTAGYGQFQAFQRTVTDPVELNTAKKGAVKVQFGIGSTSSLGSASIATPIGQVEFHIMSSNTPFLLSLADMDKLGAYFNNLTNNLITLQGSVPVVRRFGHPFLLWDTSLQAYLMDSFDLTSCYLTNTELQRLHRRFGHPSVERLQRVLERAGHEVDKRVLNYLSKYCIHCQRHGQSPGRFKFNLRDDIQFNHTIIVDIFYIQGKPVLHVVDEGTRYQAGRWLQNISAKHTWDTIRACWIDTYLGPPEQITTDAGTNFTSKEFSQLASTMGTRIKVVPVEAHNSIGIVERYHNLIRRAYTIISVEIRDLDKDMALQMAFKAINDSAGPDGLVPTLLVYGAYPRLSETDVPSPLVIQRALALKKATAEIQRIRARRQVADALNSRNGPNTVNIHNLQLNSDMLVWREGNTGQPGAWKGPYKLLSIEGESCVLALPHGPTTFRNTVVKPYLVPEALELIEGIDLPVDLPVEPPVHPPAVTPVNPPAVIPIKRGRGRPRKYPIESNTANLTVFLQEEHQFTESRLAEIQGLLEKGVFKVATTVPEGTRIFNSRFVDEVKNKGTDKALNKSRLVVQAYHDQEKHTVLTQSPTIQRVSQRLILCLATILDKTELYLRDISQAYVQSTTTLNRDFYVRPPTELAQQLGLGRDSILRVVKPLYGVPEAGNHWFKTYHSHHTKELSMEQSTYDPCLLYSRGPSGFGVVGLQTDDTLFLADKGFAEQEQVQLQKAGFLAKDREQLQLDKDLKFNGAVVHTENANNTITLTQERQCQNLKQVTKTEATTTSSRGAIRKDLTTKEQYVAQRARGAYIASVCQPEAAFDLSVAAQAKEPTETEIKALNTRIQWQRQNAARGLTFTKLDKNSLQLLVFTDASFANNKDLSSQIGYVLVLADSSGKGNILHWSSVKCKRVTRSVLASELYAMAHGFDISTAIKSTIDRILGKLVPIVLCTDSKSLYDCLVKLGTTAEKRLMIDIMCLRQAYERREIAEVKWIKGNTNPADSMTKGKASGALKQLLDTNTVQLEVVEWVERGDGD
jgi:hypothetical protein